MKMVQRYLLLLRFLVQAGEDDFQLYLPTDRDEAFDGARSSVLIESGERLAVCFWFKSVNNEGGEIVRFSNTEENTILIISTKENKLLISTPNDRSEISLATVDIRDFRWHQTCVDCGNDVCETYLDGFKTPPIDTADFPSLTGQRLYINIGYGAQFEGKVQKLQIGAGSDENDGTESRTVCGVEYRTISTNLQLYTIRAEDLLITRPIHTRDYESVCNDLLSVDCGLDSISVSISHDHLASVGENGKFYASRLSLMKECANYTIKDFTTFTISPPDACGSEYVTSQQDRTIRNSVLSYANDGQVFTADFQCKYPIDVTAVEYVEPVTRQDVKFRQKIVSVGLSRFESNDFKNVMDNGLDVEHGELFHMAAVTPDEIDRDVRILVKSCEANGVELLADFGCHKSDMSYVYSNGDSASARFTVRIPDWVVDFRCKIALCDWGEDCTVKCGKMGPRLRRDIDGESQEDITEPMGTTEGSFMPIVTTPDTIIEEIWTEQRTSLDNLSLTTVAFGPLNWITVTSADTTVLPVLDTTMGEDNVYTTNMPVVAIDSGNKSDREVTTGLPESVTDEELMFVVEDILVVKEDIIVVKEEELPDSSMPGWSSILVISLSTLAFVVATVVLSLKWHGSKSESKLLSGSY